MTLKGAALLVVALIILLGATGGDGSAAAIGDAIGSAVHWLQVAWEAAVGNDGA
jgi:hypothetical protein